VPSCELLGSFLVASGKVGPEQELDAEMIRWGAMAELRVQLQPRGIRDRADRAGRLPLVAVSLVEGLHQRHAGGGVEERRVVLGGELLQVVRLRGGEPDRLERRAERLEGREGRGVELAEEEPAEEAGDRGEGGVGYPSFRILTTVLLNACWPVR